VAYAAWMSDPASIRANHTARIEAVINGVGTVDDLLDAGYQLAMLRDPGDVWRHWEAKIASYDTFHVYPAAYLAAAGLELTVAWVTATPHRFRSDVLEYLRAIGPDDLALTPPVTSP